MALPPPRAALDLGLDRMLGLLAGLGQPHQSFPAVHVGGTNGKGSVCAYVESALRAAGYHTGRFVSPFLVEPRDGVIIDGATIAEDDWRDALAEVQRAAAATPLTAAATTFECWAAAAFLLFARARVDVAVIEVGVGGRTDATNVFSAPLCAAITSIALDHVGLLGPMIVDIARHKAGIIKAGCRVVVAPGLAPAVSAVFDEEAAAVGATLCVAAPLVWADKPARMASVGAGGDSIHIPLLGDLQLENAAVALAVLRHLATLPALARLGLDHAIPRGFAATTWPGRLQLVTIRRRGGSGGEQGTRFLLDGGHNEAAIIRVRHAVDELCAATGATRTMFIYAGTNSRDAGAILTLLLRRGDGLIAVPFSTPEGMPWIGHHPTAHVVATAERVLRGDSAPAAALTPVDPRSSVLPVPVGKEGEGVGSPRSLDVREATCVEAAVRMVEEEGDGGGATLYVICGSLYLVSDVFRSAGLVVEV